MGIYFVYYGAKRIKGIFVYSGKEVIHLFIIKLSKGDKEYSKEKKRLRSGWKNNVRIAIESFISGLLLFLGATFFFLIGIANCYFK
jgi:hypothetical protein